VQIIGTLGLLRRERGFFPRQNFVFCSALGLLFRALFLAVAFPQQSTQHGLQRLVVFR
jgi:hypothetical protein